MLAFALEINAQLITGLIVVGGVIGVVIFSAYKRFMAEKTKEASAEVIALQGQLKAQTDVARVYEDLYRAEKESHSQTKERLQTIEHRLKTLEEQYATVMELNVKHQTTMREQAHTINNLRERLRANDIAHEDIK